MLLHQEQCPVCNRMIVPDDNITPIYVVKDHDGSVMLNNEPSFWIHLECHVMETR